MRKIKFYKMTASGNDFILLDRRKVNVNLDKNAIKRICNRKFGIGADGVLLIEKSKNCDFRMRIFNSDGSEPTMCGNGARCSALYFFSQSKKKNITIQTGAGVLEAKSKGKNKVIIKMTDPHSFETDVHLDANGTKYILNYIDTGVPHVVIFSNDIENIDIKNMGSLIRFHKRFSPQGANVNFVKILGKDAISVRTYERGVEDETLACGTGSVASAVVFGSERPELNFAQVVNVHTRSGEVLKVYFKSKDNKFYDVWLEGNASLVFQGSMDI